jgi:hypothetical protein
MCCIAQFHHSWEIERIGGTLPGQGGGVLSEILARLALFRACPTCPASQLHAICPTLGDFPATIPKP